VPGNQNIEYSGILYLTIKVDFVYYNQASVMTKSGGIMDRKPNNVNKFWLSYRGVVIASGIPEKTAEWYVHWVEFGDAL